MKHIVLFGTWCLFFLSGCESSIASDPCDDYVTLFEQESDYIPYDRLSTPYFIHHLDNGCRYQVDYTIEANLTQKFIVVATNPSSSAASSTSVINASSPNVVASSIEKNANYHSPNVVRFNTHPPQMSKNELFTSHFFRANTISSLEPTVVPIDENVTLFADLDHYYDTDQTRITSVSKVVRTVNVGDYNVTLNVLVDPTGTQPTNEMLTVLADAFLKEGVKNDIYDWVTSLVGTPWGAHSSESYIPAIEAQAITVVLYEIPSINGGTLAGYFYSKDNYKQHTTFSDGTRIEGSNERLIFYLHKSLFIDTATRGMIISTLAHEFQHMIQFYQKQVFRSTSYIEVWEDEMASMMIEDLLANKLGVDSPAEMRIADYVKAITTSIAEPSNNFYLRHYGASYAYGAYLLRNYGGATFLQKMVQNEYGDRRAVNKAFSDLGYMQNFDKSLQQFGAALVLSDLSDLPAGYGFGAASSSVDGVDYNVTAINFYSYGLALPLNRSDKNATSNNFTTLTPTTTRTSINALLPSGWQLTIIGR